MFKIVALTDLSKAEEHQEDETITQVTKEAQVINFIKDLSFLLIQSRLTRMIEIVFVDFSSLK